MKQNELIQRLIVKGLITTDDVMEAERSIVSGDMKEMLETLHLKYCELNHDTKECLWYVEELMVEGDMDTWDMTHHLWWRNSFNSFLARANSAELIPETISENLPRPSDD